MKKISIFTKIKNFIFAFYKHVRTGMKKCNESTILRRLYICKECEFFVKAHPKSEIKGHCGKCGCILSDKKVTFNKLAWKEQKCPDGRW